MKLNNTWKDPNEYAGLIFFAGIMLIMFCIGYAVDLASKRPIETKVLLKPTKVKIVIINGISDTTYIYDLKNIR